jgi:ABC-2 type transport system ATP-binding protein
MADLALDISEVRKIYKGKVEALRGVSLKVPKGLVFGLLGPNGAGKSTLVKILTTIIRPTSCQGVMLGQPIGHKPTLAKIGYLPEHARFPEYLTGAQVLEFTAGLSGISKRAAAGRAGELLELVGMTDWQHKPLGSYSKGMKQRVGVAQALINDPEIIFLDEPTDGVDPAGRRDIRVLMERLKEEGRTVFVNSHLLGELELICDEVAILSKGEVKLQGKLKELTGKQVEFRVAYEGHLPGEARALVERFSCREEPGVLIVPALKPAEVMPLVDGLRAQGVVLSGLERQSMSLEDIFIDVVGTDRPGAAPPPLRKKVTS